MSPGWYDPELQGSLLSYDPPPGVEESESDGSCHFHYISVVHHKHGSEGQTIKQYYGKILLRLHDAVCLKRMELWKSGNWWLHHGNNLVHSAHLTQDFLGMHSTPQVPLAPNSLDMFPCNFWLFPKLQLRLNGSQLEWNSSECDATAGSPSKTGLSDMFPAMEGWLTLKESKFRTYKGNYFFQSKIGCISTDLIFKHLNCQSSQSELSVIAKFTNFLTPLLRQFLAHLSPHTRYFENFVWNACFLSLLLQLSMPVSC